MVTKRGSRTTKNVELVRATVLDMSVNAHLTMVVDAELLKKRQKAGKDQFTRENEFSYAVVSSPSHGKILRINGDCAFEAEVSEKGQRGKVFRHKVTAVGRFQLYGESEKLEDGASLKLPQLWPYMSMFIWWIKDFASDQLNRVGAPSLEIPMPTMTDLEEAEAH